VNRWPGAPAFEWRARYVRVGIGDVAEGLCGGMCFTTADRFLRGETPPLATEPPAPGTPLFREIARRQLESLEFGLVPLRFWMTAARVRAGRWSAHDQVREWRAIRAEIDAARPAMLGLIRSADVNPFSLTHNHQVLGFAYEADAGAATIRIYDPNYPGRDDVSIRLRLSGVHGGLSGGPGVTASANGADQPDAAPVSLEQTTGEPLLALLRLPYRPSPAR
jgi:hypothetical protein